MVSHALPRPSFGDLFHDFNFLFIFSTFFFSFVSIFITTCAKSTINLRWNAIIIYTEMRKSNGKMIIIITLIMNQFNGLTIQSSILYRAPHANYLHWDRQLLHAQQLWCPTIALALCIRILNLSFFFLFILFSSTRLFHDYYFVFCFLLKILFEILKKFGFWFCREFCF